MFLPSLSEADRSCLAHRLRQEANICARSVLEVCVELIPKRTVIDQITGHFPGFTRTLLMVFAAILLVHTAIVSQSDIQGREVGNEWYVEVF